MQKYHIIILKLQRHRNDSVPLTLHEFSGTNSIRMSFHYSRLLFLDFVRCRRFTYHTDVANFETNMFQTNQSASLDAKVFTEMMRVILVELCPRWLPI